LDHRHRSSHKSVEERDDKSRFAIETRFYCKALKDAKSPLRFFVHACGSIEREEKRSKPDRQILDEYSAFIGLDIGRFKTLLIGFCHDSIQQNRFYRRLEGQSASCSSPTYRKGRAKG